MSKMWSLFSLVVLAALTTASTTNERVFSRLLAQKEGYKLTKEQQLVDAYMTVLDHITKNKDPYSFNGDDLLNMLKKKRDVPFLAALEKKFQPIHKASKSGVHDLGVILDLWEGIAKEDGMNFYDSMIIMSEHELFEEVSKRMNPGN